MSHGPGFGLVLVRPTRARSWSAQPRFDTGSPNWACFLCVFCTLLGLHPNCALIAPFSRLTFLLIFLLDYGIRFFFSSTGSPSRPGFFGLVLVCPTGLGGCRFLSTASPMVELGWVLVRPTGPGGVSFFNGLPNGPGGFVFQWFAQRVWRGFVFQWSAQRARGVRFSMVRPTRLEGFRFSMVCPTGLEGVSFFSSSPNV